MMTKAIGAESWFPINSTQRYDLNKQEIRDCVRLRYDWRLTDIPSKYSCGYNMDIQHAMSCKKAGFITTRPP